MLSTRATLQLAGRHRVSALVQQRSLHLTGAANTPSYVLGAERASTLELPEDVPGLRAACKKQGLSANGSKADLRDRLQTWSIRQFSMAASKRPQEGATAATSTRSFNTSRALKKPGDSSTIDFMYFPSDIEVNSYEPELIRVPILPDNTSTRHVDLYSTKAAETVVQKPTISVIGGESTHISSPSAMAEIHDNAGSADRHILSEIAGQVSDAARQVAIGAEKQGEIAGGIAKQIWKGFLDDVFGVKRKQLVV